LELGPFEAEPSAEEDVPSNCILFRDEGAFERIHVDRGWYGSIVAMVELTINAAGVEITQAWVGVVRGVEFIKVDEEIVVPRGPTQALVQMVVNFAEAMQATGACCTAFVTLGMMAVVGKPPMDVLNSKGIFSVVGRSEHGSVCLPVDR